MPFAKKKANDINAARRGAMEVQILSDLAKLQQGFAKVEKTDGAFAVAEAQLRQTMAAVSSGTRRALGDAAIEKSRLDFAGYLMSIILAIGELGVTAENSYRAYPHEVDAHRVGHAVRTAFATAEAVADNDDRLEPVVRSAVRSLVESRGVARSRRRRGRRVRSEARPARPRPHNSVGSTVGERLHEELGVTDLSGAGEDVSHPVVGLERLALGDAERGQLAVEGAVLGEGRLLVDQVVEDLPEAKIGLPSQWCEVGADLAGEFGVNTSCSGVPSRSPNTLGCKSGYGPRVHRRATPSAPNQRSAPEPSRPA